jgi:hypothetical protein
MENASSLPFLKFSHKTTSSTVFAVVELAVAVSSVLPSVATMVVVVGIVYQFITISHISID